MITRSAPTAPLLQACLRLSRGFSRKILNQAVIASLALLSSAQHRLGATEQDAIDPSLNEHVIYVMGDSTRRAMLQVTTFYPDGAGPFPLAVINHSKAIGDPKNEPRYRSMFLGEKFTVNLFRFVGRIWDRIDIVDTSEAGGRRRCGG